MLRRKSIFLLLTKFIIMEQEKLSAYPFEVMYTDGTKSKLPQEGKTIWGVMFCDRAISLQSSPDIYFDEAQKYCRGIKVGEKTCTCGDKNFWEQVIRQGKAKIAELNAFITELGGTPLKGRIWTKESCRADDAWLIYFNEEVGLSYGNRLAYYVKARPIV